jgi:hypothetical protein
MLSPHRHHQDSTRNGSRGNRLRCLADHRTRRRTCRRRLHPSLPRKRGASSRELGSHSTHIGPDSLCNRDTGSRAGIDRRAASRAAHHRRGSHRCSTRGGGVMQTLLNILKRAGGWNPSLYLKIENAPYMALVIEATGESGPSGLPAISVAHYGEQPKRNGAKHRVHCLATKERPDPGFERSPSNSRRITFPPVSCLHIHS